jgi:two-component system sensor histidine kinase BaeS
MSRRRYYQQHGEWWQGPGEGREAWGSFERRMATRFMGFMLIAALVIVVGIGGFIATVFSNLNLFTGVLVVVFTPVLLAGIIARIVRGTRPIRDLIRATGELADGDYTARVAATDSPSTRDVVSSFNNMANRLEAAENQRRMLLADLGHELRTPLTVIRGEIEAMLDGVHTLDRSNLEPMLGEVAVMERLLEDLRTLSQLESGTLRLHPEPTDVSTLISDLVDSYRRRAVAAGVEITVEGPPVEMMIDPVRIREVLANVMTNSLRAMPDGGTLSIVSRPSGDGTIISVADTGIGIDPDDLDHVFDRFHKGSTSTGSGLGLTISRDLVQAHGGTIAIESPVGSGTTVTIDLSNVRPSTTTVST